MSNPHGQQPPPYSQQTHPGWVPQGPPARSRTPVYVALTVAVVVVLAAVGGAAWWVKKDQEPAVAQPTAAISTPATSVAGTHATCKAAFKMPDLPPIKDYPPVIALAGTSDEPELQAIAVKYADLDDYLDARAALRAIAAWCDDHDVEWPNGG